MLEKQIFLTRNGSAGSGCAAFWDVIAVVSTLLWPVFSSMLRNQHLPELLLPVAEAQLKALPDRPPALRGARSLRPTRRKTDRKPRRFPSTPAKFARGLLRPGRRG